jgi:hypothetical protein
MGGPFTYGPNYSETRTLGRCQSSGMEEDSFADSGVEEEM